VSPQAIPRLAPGCRLSEDPRQPELLLIPEGELRLIGPGLEILKRVDGRRTLAAIVENLSAAYPQADAARIKRETGAFLERLWERGLLRLE
jgi:pyrroloquinoline quinone biosynthesis protein D